MTVVCEWYNFVMDPGLSNVLEKLYRKTGYDLRGYRESTLARRVARRLHATRSTDYPSYVRTLESSPEECHFLLKDLTIRVTDFFRDWSEETLCKHIWPSLANQNFVKIWSAGCATGEETYSLAFSFDRFLKENGLKTPYEVIGSDIDEASIHFAKRGEYPKEKLKDLVISDIKKSVRFEKLDLVGENFPADIDLIVCRNVLIYFAKELQEKVLLKFYHSLRPGGFLWLGKAECLSGRAQEFFEPIDKPMKIFKRRQR